MGLTGIDSQRVGKRRTGLATPYRAQKLNANDNEGMRLAA